MIENAYESFNENFYKELEDKPVTYSLPNPRFLRNQQKLKLPKGQNLLPLIHPPTIWEQKLYVQ